jgi:hypothetical protein
MRSLRLRHLLSAGLAFEALRDRFCNQVTSSNLLIRYNILTLTYKSVDVKRKVLAVLPKERLCWCRAVNRLKRGGYGRAVRTGPSVLIASR